MQTKRALRVCAIGLAAALMGGVAQARESATEQHFICAADARVAADLRAEICAGFLAHLRQTYPKVVFTPASSEAAPSDRPGLELRLLRASRFGAALQLVWTDAAGKVTQGREAGLSVMDREMSAPMLDKLFERALSERPMP